MAEISSPQPGMRSKLGNLVDGSTSAINEPTEVTKGLRNIVGWLKQVYKLFNIISILIMCVVLTEYSKN